MYLIFDCSAIAGPTNYKANFTETQAWPRLIHISWILLGEDYKPIEDFDCIPQSTGVIIDDKSKEKAHIDDEDIKKKMSSLEEVLDKFTASAAKAEFIFAHNLNYNENILGAEFVRFKKEYHFFLEEKTLLDGRRYLLLQNPFQRWRLQISNASRTTRYLFWTNLRACRQCKSRRYSSN